METSFYEDLIFLDLKAKDQTEAISFIADRLYEKGFVTEDFKKKILIRESNYPTGIEIGDINVAIPHSDHIDVKKGAVSVAVLKNPVLFHRMDEPEKEIEVSIIMVLAIATPKGHVELLQKVFAFIQDQDLLKEIVSSDDKNRVLELVKEQLKGE